MISDDEDDDERFVGKKIRDERTLKENFVCSSSKNNDPFLHETQLANIDIAGIDGSNDLFGEFFFKENVELK